jgi:hypothetical protein
MTLCRCPKCGEEFDPKEHQAKVNVSAEWEEVVAKWNIFSDKTGVPKVRKNNTAVRVKFASRFREYKGDPQAFWDDFRSACALTMRRRFYLGDNDTGWMVSLDYMMRPGNMQKLAAEYAALKAKEAKNEQPGTLPDRRPEGCDASPARLGGAGRSLPF